MHTQEQRISQNALTCQFRPLTVQYEHRIITMELAMATDSTLQKIADNLLAQFDKTLLDNSTDFSSCDQILNAAPSEHKGGLESLYCDLLLDALISGYYRYSEMNTKQLVDDPLYTKFKKMVYGLDRSDPYNLLYYAIIDLVIRKERECSSVLVGLPR